ncbi:hypothetical protein SAMN02799630_03326 [Paenibacillus sp. UNCCL117]|nr:hypothetical protein SAMN04488602_112141 [Paenibacillus sp. cl123]SFW45822.1 hypothetical protein SAMN02799630_03326 [Paenibacillus sp. UNCCL117]
MYKTGWSRSAQGTYGKTSRDRSSSFDTQQAAVSGAKEGKPGFIRKHQESELQPLEAAAVAGAPITIRENTRIALCKAFSTGAISIWGIRIFEWLWSGFFLVRPRRMDAEALLQHQA